MHFRIAIDGYRLVGPRTSVGTYTEELLNALLEGNNEVVLLVPHEEPGSLLEGIRKQLPHLEVLSPAAAEAPDEDWGKLVRWNQRVIPRLLENVAVDALISTYHQVPVRVPARVARIAIIHDCCGLRADCGYRQYGRAWWRHWSNLKSAAVFADAVVPISQATHDDFLRLYPGSRERLVKPIYNRVSRTTLDLETTRSEIDRWHLATFGYLLGFALPGKRKGTDVALRAYSEYRKNGGKLPLVLMGDSKIDLQSWGLLPEFDACVIRVGRVSDEQRDALYAHAACFLFFSRCEGFGYPIIEAARQGCPVVAWDHGTATELLEDSQPMLRHLDPTEGGAMILRFTDLSMSERSSIRNRLIGQSLRFSKDETTTGFVAAVAKAIAHRTGRPIS
jgi:glycosyltransferase involved in cell wall biosynthesis